MSVSERGLYFAPDGIPTGPAVKPVEDVYNTEILREGDFVEALGGFLKGYFSDRIEQHPHYTEIPHVVGQLLIPVLEYQEKDALVVRGSLAKCIAAGIPADFWEYRRYFREKAASLEALNNRAVNEILTGFNIVQDIDLKIRLQNDSTIMSLYGWYVHILKNAHEIYAADSHVIADDKTREYVRNERRFHYSNHFDIAVEAGPNPVNLRRQLMTISINDVRSQKGVFHVDIGEFSRTSFDQEAERRLGKTSLKQDECLIPLFLREGKPQYQLPRPVEKLMQMPDEITTETENADDVIDLFLRALRINLLHEIKSIPMENGKPLLLPKLDMLFPQFKSDSLLALYDRMIEFHGRGEQIGDNFRLPIMRELVLCLSIDPYVTVQALRDSGIFLLIPGLRSISKDQWDRILRSRWFVVAPKVSSVKERTFHYIEQERVRYRYGDPAIQLHKPYDGLERFILALRDLRLVDKTSNEWVLFIKLFDPQKAMIMPIDTLEQSIDMSETGAQPLGVRLDDKEFLVYATDNGEPPSQQDIDRLMQLFREQASGRDLERRVSRASQAIRRYMAGTHVGDLIKRTQDLDDLNRSRGLKLTDGEKDELIHAMNHVNSVAMLYAIIGEFASGLTPRQLVHLYNSLKYKQPDFKDVFFDLKSLGVIGRYRQRRVHQRGHLEYIDFYFLRTDPIVNRLNLLVLNRDFFEYVDRQAELKSREMKYPLTMKDMVTVGLVSLPMAGITTAEALAVVTRKDLEVMYNRLRNEGIDSIDVDLMGRLAQTILNFYQGYIEEQSD